MKIVIYVVLIAGLIFCTLGFLRDFQSATDVPPPDPVPLTEEPSGMDPGPGNGDMMTYGAFGFMCVLLLGFMVAYDVSRYLGAKTEEFLLSADEEGLRDPGYDEAEQTWANGDHLEAIREMRELLKKNPTHQYVAIRIAEIYEKDLGNPLAAALEYDQILKHNLPAERWGWAAIHLANIYTGKLDKPDEAEALLRRIIDDYGHTAAAKKARERLGEPEPVEETPDANESSEVNQSTEKSNLPPGFRPKKD